MDIKSLSLQKNGEMWHLSVVSDTKNLDIDFDTLSAAMDYILWIKNTL